LKKKKGGEGGDSVLLRKEEEEKPVIASLILRPNASVKRRKGEAPHPLRGKRRGKKENNIDL